MALAWDVFHASCLVELWRETCELQGGPFLFYSQRHEIWGRTKDRIGYSYSNSSLLSIRGFPVSSVGKESACNAGDPRLIPGLGRSPGEGKGYPLQYSGLENSMDCIVHGGRKELDTTEWLSLSLCTRQHLLCTLSFFIFSPKYMADHSDFLGWEKPLVPTISVVFLGYSKWPRSQEPMGKDEKVLTWVCASSVIQSCLTLCDPLDCSPPASSIHGIFQAGIQEWFAVSSSRGSSRAHVFCVSWVGRQILDNWVTWEALMY